MYLVLNSKSININNINLVKNKSVYIIKYEVPFYKMYGLCFPIKIKNYINYNNLQYIYINDINTISLLKDISEYISVIIRDFKLLRVDKYNNYYLIISKIFKINSNNIIINIKYIKYLNNKYIPIIHII